MLCQENPRFGCGRESDEFAHRCHSAQYCLDVIGDIRRETRRLLASFGEDDLERVCDDTRGERTIEVSLRWALHYLIDHEAQHKGQILMLKRLLGSEPSGLDGNVPR